MRFNIINFDDFFNPENVITTNQAMVKKNFAINGIYSENIWGKLYGNEIDYSCTCGNLFGEYNLGLKCNDCDSEVIRKDSIINKMGWIYFKDYKLINPFFFPFIAKYIGKLKLNKILKKEIMLDLNGNILEDFQEEEKNPFVNKYKNLGVTEFINNFDAIMEEVEKEDENLKNFLLVNRDKLFINKFPIFSHRLRPAVFFKDTIIFDKINTLFTQIITSNEGLQKLCLDKNEMSVNEFVNEIQRLLNCVYIFIIDIISGKNGLIRSNILGSRLNFSSRCVIIPLPSETRMDEIHLPYVCMLELLKVHIINALTKIKGITLIEAQKKIIYATSKFDREIYEIMNDLMLNTEGGLTVCINRNPTINIGSILQCRVTKIKDNINDYTMSISNNILKFISGDFDGDVLNIFLLIDPRHKKYFSKFNPKCFTIDLDDGNFNNIMGLDKDHALGIQTLLEV